MDTNKQRVDIYTKDRQKLNCMFDRQTEGVNAVFTSVHPRGVGQRGRSSGVVSASIGQRSGIVNGRVETSHGAAIPVTENNITTHTYIHTYIHTRTAQNREISTYVNTDSI